MFSLDSSDCGLPIGRPSCPSGECWSWAMVVCEALSLSLSLSMQAGAAVSFVTGLCLWRSCFGMSITWLQDIGELPVASKRIQSDCCSSGRRAVLFSAVVPDSKQPRRSASCVLRCHGASSAQKYWQNTLHMIFYLYSFSFGPSFTVNTDGLTPFFR